MTFTQAIPAIAGSQLPELSTEAQVKFEAERRAFAKRARRDLHAITYPDFLNTEDDHIRRMVLHHRSMPADCPARGRKREILAAAIEVELRAIWRAKRAREMKLRIAYGIPLHEWADAALRTNGREVLLQVYAPDAAKTLPPYVAPRCPPWASRKYRAACGR